MRSTNGTCCERGTRTGARVIYDEPVIRLVGDAYIGVEFGDEADISLNFRVLALATALEAHHLRGVLEIIPSMRSLAIIYDASDISPVALSDSVRQILGDAQSVTSLESRILRLPVWYNDPWSRQVAAEYNVRNNLELVAEVNGLTTEEAVANHTSTQHWVTCLAAVPGCYLALPLDTRKGLRAPKYERPRLKTPARIVALAGLLTGCHPIEGPGGYQCIGRMAVNIYEPEQRNAAFRDTPFLTRPTDRHEYVAVEEEDYGRIWGEYANGTYEYEIEEAVFDVEDYLQGGAPMVGDGG